MVIGSWHGPRVADHSRYERKERERIFQNMMSAALKKMLGNSTVCLDSHLLEIHPYGVISCLCAIPYIHKPEALGRNWFITS